LDFSKNRQKEVTPTGLYRNGRNWSTHMMRISEMNPALWRQIVELWCIESVTLHTHMWIKAKRRAY